MFVVRHQDLMKAIDPKRNLVKLSDPVLWKPPWPEGIDAWQPGHEIRSEHLGMSLFRTGTDEKAHFHERTWEMYQVLKGNLRIAVRPYRKSPWVVVELAELDFVWFSPGTAHLVDTSCDHLTQVIQTPPALSDQVLLPEEEKITALAVLIASREKLAMNHQLH